MVAGSEAGTTREKPDELLLARSLVITSDIFDNDPRLPLLTRDEVEAFAPVLGRCSVEPFANRGEGIRRGAETAANILTDAVCGLTVEEIAVQKYNGKRKYVSSAISAASDLLRKRQRRYGEDLLGELLEEAGIHVVGPVAEPPEPQVRKTEQKTRSKAVPVNWNEYRDSSDSSEINLDKFLGDSGWGPDYPSELLRLTDSEQKIWAARQQGDTFVKIAERLNLRYAKICESYRSAAGKLEADAGKDRDIRELGPEAQKIIAFNRLFGDWWHNSTEPLMSRPLDRMVRSAAFLDERLGVRWRRFPIACGLPIETLAPRCDLYDTMLGSSWTPVILTLKPEVVTARIALLDKAFGARWRPYTALLANTPKTVMSSSRALQAIGITPENCSISRYFQLLGTSTTLKRKRVIDIRRSILGHEQVWEYPKKVRLSEVVKRRASQTPQEKVREEKELYQLRAFIRSTHLLALTKPIEKTRQSASEHGYKTQSPD